MIELTGITWDHPRGYAPLRACARFEDIHVRWDVRSLKDFGDHSLSDLAARYDLLILDHPHIGEASQGVLIPFDDLLGSEAIVSLRAENDTLSFRSYNYSDRQWALPIDTACQVASYRKDLLNHYACPTNWEEVFQLAVALKSTNLHIGLALCPTDTLCSFLTICAQLNDAPVSNKWIQRDTAFAAIKHLSRLRDASHPDCLNWNPIQLYEHMSSKDATVAYCPLAFGYTDYSRANSTSTYRLEFTGIPESRFALLGGAGIGISAHCTNPIEAARYATWICSPEIQSSHYSIHNGQPAHKAAWNSKACDTLTGGFINNTRTTLESAYTRPRLMGWPEFQEALGDTVHSCLRGTISIQHTIDMLEKLHKKFINHKDYPTNETLSI